MKMFMLDSFVEQVYLEIIPAQCTIWAIIPIAFDFLQLHTNVLSTILHLKSCFFFRNSNLSDQIVTEMRLADLKFGLKFDFSEDDSQLACFCISILL